LNALNGQVLLDPAMPKLMPLITTAGINAAEAEAEAGTEAEVEGEAEATPKAEVEAVITMNRRP
jgi:hypothetical protein